LKNEEENEKFNKRIRVQTFRLATIAKETLDPKEKREMNENHNP